MKSPKLKVILCMCIIFILLIYAYTSENRKEDKFVETLDDFPLKYIEEGKRLNFSVDIIINSDTNCLYKCKAIKSKIRSKEAHSLINNNKNHTFINEDRSYYTGPNGESMFLKGDYLSFSTNSELEKIIVTDFQLFPEYYATEKFSSINHSDDLWIINGKKEIENVLCSLGIDKFNLFKYYVLDGQTLQKNEKYIDKSENMNLNDCRNDLAEKDNSAYWVGIETWCGVPVFCSSFSAEISDVWMPIQVLYTKDRIEKLQILYHFDFEKGAEKFKLKPFEEITEALKEKYSKVLTDNKYDVTKAELFFWVDVNQEDIKFQMKPVWNFTLREYKKGVEKDYVDCLEIVDAETAKVLEIGG